MVVSKNEEVINCFKPLLMWEEIWGKVEHGHTVVHRLHLCSQACVRNTLFSPAFLSFNSVQNLDVIYLTGKDFFFMFFNVHVEYIRIRLLVVFLLIAQTYCWFFSFIMICCVYTHSNKEIICPKYHLHVKKPNKKWKLWRQECTS